MIAAMVTPLGRHSSPSTRACLEFARVRCWSTFLRLVAFDRPLEADRVLVDRARLLLDMAKTPLEWCRRNSAPPPPKPRGGLMGAGGGEERAGQARGP